MTSHNYKRDMLNRGALPYGHFAAPALFNDGNLIDGNPGIQKVAYNLVSDSDGKNFSLLSGFDVTYASATTTATITAGYMLKEGEIETITGDTLSAALNNYVFVGTGADFVTSANITGVQGLLLGRVSATNTFTDMRNKTYVSGTDLIENHSNKQRYDVAINETELNLNYGTNTLSGYIDASNADMETHINDNTSVHGATSAATASRMVNRNSSGDFAAHDVTLNKLTVTDSTSEYSDSNPTQKTSHRDYDSEVDIAIEKKPNNYRIVKIFTLDGLKKWVPIAHDHAIIMNSINMYDAWASLIINADYVLMEGGKIIIGERDIERIAISGNHCTIKDIEINSTSNGALSSISILITGTHNTINNVNIIGDGTNGIGVACSITADQNIISNCHIGSVNKGVLLTGDDNIVVGNCLKDCTNGIDVDGTGNTYAGNNGTII